MRLTVGATGWSPFPFVTVPYPGKRATSRSPLQCVAKSYSSCHPTIPATTCATAAYNALPNHIQAVIGPVHGSRTAPTCAPKKNSLHKTPRLSGRGPVSCLSLPLRRGTEVAVTGPTRNRVVGDEPARGFESHPLRHFFNDFISQIREKNRSFEITICELKSAANRKN